MEKQTQNFLSLIRAFIWNTPPRLQEPDWKVLFHLSKLHNLTPAVYHVSYKLPEFSSAPESVRKRFMETALAQSSAQFLRTQEFFAVYEELLKNNIKPLVLKGLICRSLYEQPDLRPSGDEDLWIPKKDFHACSNILKNLGYLPDMNDSEELLDTIQEVTFTNGSLKLEVHMEHPFGTSDSLRKKMNELFQSSFQEAYCTCVQGYQVYTLTPTEHFLFLFAHLYKHFLLSGAGIRLFLDFLLFWERFQTEINFDRIRFGVAFLEADTVYSAIMELGRQYLGFSSIPPAKNPVSLEPLMNDIIESGAFGNNSRFQSLSGTYLFSKTVSKDKKIPALILMLFPSADRMYPRYPFLIHRPWLIPAAWVMRIFRFTKESLTSEKSLVFKSLHRGNRRLKLFKKYKIKH